MDRKVESAAWVLEVLEVSGDSDKGHWRLYGLYETEAAAIQDANDRINRTAHDMPNRARATILNIKGERG